MIKNEKIIKVEYKGIIYNIKIIDKGDELEINCFQNNKIDINQYVGVFLYNNLKNDNVIFTIYVNNSDICELIINQIENGKFSIEKKNDNMNIILEPIIYKIKEIILPLKPKILEKENFIPIILNLLNLTDEKYLDIKNTINNYLSEIEIFKKENTELKIQNYILKKDIEKLKRHNIYLRKDINSLLLKEKTNIKTIKKEITSLKRILLLNNLKQNNIIKEHKNIIYQISVFPNGRFASISSDCKIKIYNNNYSEFLIINEAHLNHIYTLLIINDYNFLTCSNDKSIKKWNFTENKKYYLEETINEAHEKGITKIIFFSKDNILKYLISCSYDKKIKIWERKKTEGKQKKIYINIKILNEHKESIRSILQLNDNILVSGGDDGIKTFNINNFQLILSISKCDCYSRNGLIKYDNNTIIVGGSNQKLRIVNVNFGIVLNCINSFSNIWSILILENGLIFTGSEDKELRAFEINNNEIQFLYSFKNAHNDTICTINQLKDFNIIIGSGDGNISIWDVNSNLI